MHRLKGIDLKPLLASAALVAVTTIWIHVRPEPLNLRTERLRTTYTTTTERRNHQSLFERAARIHRPEDFQPFERVLRDITGRDPVPIRRIRFVNWAELIRTCGRHTAACYLANQDHILIGPEFQGTSTTTESRTENCGGIIADALWSRSRLGGYLHEEGHAHDIQLDNMWIDQTEAEAFMLYIAQRIAEGYDQRLGLNLLINEFTSHDIFNLLEDPASGAERAKTIFALTRGRFDERDSTIADTTLISILADPSMTSFADVWNFIHTHSNSQVIEVARRNQHALEDGLRKARNIINNLAGWSITTPWRFNEQSLEEFELSRLIGIRAENRISSENAPERYWFEVIDLKNNRVEFLRNANIITITIRRGETSDFQIELRPNNEMVVTIYMGTISITRRSQGNQALITQFGNSGTARCVSVSRTVPIDARADRDRILGVLRKIEHAMMTAASQLQSHVSEVRRVRLGLGDSSDLTSVHHRITP